MPGQTDTNGYLKISLASGGTISGDQTFTGNVTIQGNLNFGDASVDVLTITAPALGTTPTNNLVLQNTTAAAAGAQQVSPAILLRGNGWKTDATAASQTCDIKQYVLPIQGAAAPIASWVLASSVAGGADANLITANTGGINLNYITYLNENTVLASNRAWYIGAGTASGFIFSTPQTVDSTMMFLDSTSRTLLITDNANKAKDHDHTGQTNPTLFIHSATDPDSANNQWISLSHDQTDGIISVGTGLVKTAANMQVATLTCSSLTNGIILSGSVNNGVIYANTTTNQLVFGVGSNLGRQLILTNAANRSSDHDHDAQTNPTFYVHSATDPDTNNTQWVSLAHNQTDAVIETGLGGIYHKQAGTVMADDGTITLPNATSGWGEVFVGDNEERARFSWTTAGVVTLMENTANVVNTDTDTKFCIYDSGTAVVIKNALGASKTVKYVINY